MQRRFSRYSLASIRNATRRKWSANSSSSLTIALSGSLARRKRLPYRVFYAKKEGAEADSYLVEHTAFVYVIGPDGRYVTLLSPLQGQTPDMMAGRLRELVSQVRTGLLP